MAATGGKYPGRIIAATAAPTPSSGADATRTANRAEALAIADRIVVLAAGRIQQIATPEELLDTLAAAGVASFIADTTVVEGLIRDSRVEAETLSASGALSEIEMVGPGSSEAEIAVLPTAVEIVPPGTPGSVDATIAYALFNRDFFSLTVDTGHHSFCAQLPGARPRIGDAVGVIIRRPWCTGGRTKRRSGDA